MGKETYASIGFTKKTYGIKGAVKLNIKEEYLEDLAEADVVFLGIAGRKIPHFVELIQFEEPFTIKFEDYNSKEEAIELTAKEVFLRESDLLPPEEKIIEKERLIFEKFIGFEIRDKNTGLLGKIEEIIEYPQQEMASIFYKGKAVMIPLNEALIVDVEESKSMILMDLPEGLLDIN